MYFTLIQLTHKLLLAYQCSSVAQTLFTSFLSSNKNDLFSLLFWQKSWQLLWWALCLPAKHNLIWLTAEVRSQSKVCTIHVCVHNLNISQSKMHVCVRMCLYAHSLIWLTAEVRAVSSVYYHVCVCVHVCVRACVHTRLETRGESWVLFLRSCPPSIFKTGSLTDLEHAKVG